MELCATLIPACSSSCIFPGWYILCSQLQSPPNFGGAQIELEEAWSVPSSQWAKLPPWVQTRPCKLDIFSLTQLMGRFPACPEMLRGQTSPGASPDPAGTQLLMNMENEQVFVGAGLVQSPGSARSKIKLSPLAPGSGIAPMTQETHNFNRPTLGLSGRVSTSKSPPPALKR